MTAEETIELLRGMQNINGGLCRNGMRSCLGVWI